MSQMRKVFILFLIVLFVNVLLVFEDAQGAEGSTLHSREVDTVPVIDGSVDDGAWALASSVTTTNGIVLKSVHKGDEIFFLAIWDDSSKSITKKEWVFDGSEWDPESSSEDYMALHWNIGDTTANFNSQGCTILCHPPQMRTSSASEKIDLWQWKSARSNPSGWMDDRWLDMSGRHDDDRVAGGLAENKQDLDFTDDAEDHTDVPLYWEPDATGDDAKSITQSEIDSGETRDITEIYTDGTMKDEDGTTIPSGTLIPFYYQSKPTGSRGDISAAGTWTNGKWTLEFSRKLVTSQSDDVQFNDLDRSYYFGLALHDHNEGGSHQADPNVYELTFKDTTSTSDKESGSFLNDWLWILIILIIVVVVLIVALLSRKR